MKYGIIGDCLSHVFTKELHEKISHNDFETVTVKEEELESFLKNRDFNGLLVATSYKEKVIPYLDVVDEHAKELGSCGVIVNRGGKLYGYNTDFEGIAGLIVHSGITVRNKKVLIAGTGALGKTAAAVCESLGVNKIYQIRAESNLPLTPENYRDFLDAEVIINTTFIGRYPDIFAKPLDLTLFPKLEGVIDTVYNPIRTALVLDAKKLGIPAESGLFMLVRRTVVAEELFTGDKIKYGLNEQVYTELLREKENVVLVGMPGAGKTTVGTRVAQMTTREFVDINDLITEKYGMPASIVQTRGESALRDMEEKIIASVASKTGCVIAASDGSVLSEKNVYALKSNGKLIFLDRSLDLIDVLPDKKYPYAELSSMYSSRYPEYKKCADIIVDGDGTIKDVADTVISRFKRGISTGMPHILIINGPNVNLLGNMMPEIYGKVTYKELCEKLHKKAEEKGIKIEIFQSNSEGALIDKIQESIGVADGIIINPSSYAHTSIAIADTLRAAGVPCAEVHVSDIDSREKYRKTDYIREACVIAISGKGTEGYLQAVDQLCVKFG